MAGLSRRDVLRAALAAGVTLGIGVPWVRGAGGSSSTGILLTSRRTLPRPFTRRLPIPPVLRPVHSDGDSDHYVITQRRATASILPDVTTEIWGYEGSFPGPTIEAQRGRRAAVTHTNTLPVPTVVHLHGGHTPAASDGYPTDLVLPSTEMAATPHRAHDAMAGDVAAGSRTYVYPHDQRAATLWYHDHRMEFTGPSVWRGLAGFHLVRDAEEDALGLPSGPRELPLMITDRSFDVDGSFLYPSIDPTLLTTPGVTGAHVAGVLGDVMLVNGVPWPVAAVDGAHHRLRILNAANARRLSLRFDPAPAGGITQIGTDGGLLAAPLHHDHLELAPAQRMDVVVDFGSYPPGTAVTLVNDFGEATTVPVMRFLVGDRTTDPFTLPDRLSTIDPLTASDAVATRTLRFAAGDVNHMNGWLINGAPFEPTRADVTAARGTVEVWRLMADFHHPVHVHLNPFQVLSRGIGRPGPFDAGWKDTIDLRPAEEAAIAVRIGAYPGMYVFHCHNLEHEDMAMMGNLLVR